MKYPDIIKKADIIKRDQEAKDFQEVILQSIKGKIPHYTPEWTPDFDSEGEKDVGVALSRIFAYMAEMVIQRLNNAPQKHFLTYLETINASLITAQPARVPITFELSKGKGVPDNVPIPASTQASASGPDGKPIIFETDRNIVAAPSNLISVISAIREKDEIRDSIFDHEISIKGKESTELFKGKNKQEHILFIGDKNLLNVKKATIVIDVKGFDVEKLEKKTFVVWEYGAVVKEKEDNKEVEKEKWIKLDPPKWENGKLTIIKNTDEPIGEIKKLNGIEKNRWIRCKVEDSNIDAVKDVKISNLTISTSPEKKVIKPDMAFYNKVQINLDDTPKEFYPFGNEPKISDEFYIASKDAFSKKDCKVIITMDFLPGIPGSNNRIPQLSWKYYDGQYWKNFQEITENFISFIEGQVLGGTVNTLILGNEASSKNGAYKEMQIEITEGRGRGQKCKIISYVVDANNNKIVTVDPAWTNIPDSTSKYRVPKDVFCKDSITDNSFIRSITIQSLPEMKSKSVEGNENYWIKVSLDKGDYGDINKYCPPRIKSLKIDVLEGIKPDLAFFNDVPIDLTDTDKEFYPFGDKPQIFSAFYIASKDAFSKKDYEVSLNIDLIPGAPNSNIPKLSWEYWNGEGWNPLNVEIFEEIEEEKFKEIIDENFTLIVHEGRAQQGNYNSIDLSLTDSSTNDDYYNSMKIEISEGNGSGQIRKIVDYVGGVSRKATIDPYWDYPPDNTSKYRIYRCNNSTIIKKRINIKSMPELKPVNMNGKENYWIRIRLIGGDYGREYEIRYYEIKPGYFCPPRIKSLRIYYTDHAEAEGKTPEYIFTLNSLSLKKSDLSAVKTAEAIIQTTQGILMPFEPLHDQNPSVYFGFDRILKGDNLSLFISINEYFEYPDNFRPTVRWQSRMKDEKWMELTDISDETLGFTRSGMLQFSVPEGMVGEKMFGSETDLYWIRAEFQGKFFQSYEENGTTGDTSETSSAGLRKCEEIFKAINIGLKPDEEKMDPPKVLGLYFNSSWALQRKTIVDEIIGGSTGEVKQKFYLMNMPVIDPVIWVNEIHLTENERKELRDTLASNEIKEIKDDSGNVVEFWIQWKEVSDFIESRSKSRHYIIDGTSGELLFGDGKHGLVPQMGMNNIKATYRTGGGKSGNLEAGKISKLVSSIPFVDKVENPIPSYGGKDTEEIDALIKRAPVVLKHRNRAVALMDYELLAKEASEKVAKVKVLPNFNAEGKYQTGCVTIIIVPVSSEKKPVLAPELRHKVFTYLENRCPNVVSLKVIQPSYVMASISALVRPKTIDAISEIERQARNKITEFLHPVTGGVEKKGWDFGCVPCISDIYSQLQSIENVDSVKDVSMQLQVESDSKIYIITETSSIFKLPGYALIYSGEHKIDAKYEL